MLLACDMSLLETKSSERFPQCSQLGCWSTPVADKQIYHWFTTLEQSFVLLSFGFYVPDIHSNTAFVINYLGLSMRACLILYATGQQQFLKDKG